MVFFHGTITLIYLFIIISCCVLFTNAVEHLGKKLKLSSNATGSILAVIGTTLPETLVPLVAVLGAKIFLNNSQVGEDIALGGIIGSPFMLSCLALFILGIELIILYIFKKRDKLYLNIDYRYVLRDFKYFICTYTLALSCMFIQSKTIKTVIVCLLITSYLIYAYRTIIKSKESFCEECLDELFFSRYSKNKNDPSLFCIVSQVIVSLIGLIISIHYFVCEIQYFSKILNISPVILSLIITPFATELPECINSIIWVKNKKDDLALFNVYGAIVFQAVVPMSIGIILTPFEYNPIIATNAILVFISTIIFVILAYIKRKVSAASLILCGMFYFAFIGYLIIK